MSTLYHTSTLNSCINNILNYHDSEIDIRAFNIKKILNLFGQNLPNFGQAKVLDIFYTNSHFCALLYSTFHNIVLLFYDYQMIAFVLSCDNFHVQIVFLYHCFEFFFL